MRDSQRLGHQSVLRSHHVATVVERELHLEAAVGGTGRMLESSLCSTKRIRTDNEVLVRIERAARPDHMVEQVVVRGKTMLEQDSVVLCGIERAVSDVGHL